MSESNNAPVEVGKIQDGFLSDEQGRRIFFPPIGAPRWIQTPDDESSLRARVGWSSGIGGILAVVALIAIIFSPGSGKGATVVFMLVIACRLLGASYFARRLPKVDDRSITYRRAIVAAHLRRSYPWLFLMILVHAIGALGVSALSVLIWWPPVKWDVDSVNELIVYGYATPVVCIGFALYLVVELSRLIVSLRLKRKGALPQSL